MAEGRTRRVVLYLRLSEAKDDSTSIVRQEEDLRQLAEREGWQVAKVLTDDGISGRKDRAKAAEALELIRQGAADTLAVWKLDRWSRQGARGMSDLLNVLDAVPGSLFIALQDSLRSDAAGFGLMTAVLSEIGKAEADNVSARVKSSIGHLKRVGRFHGGVIPFGYDAVPNPDGDGRVLRLNPAEAATAREVAKRIIRGDSLPKIALWLRESGVPTVRSDYRRAAKAGKPTEGLDRGGWRAGTIQQTWTSQAILGHVIHEGKVLSEGGLPLRVWEPVIDARTHALIQRKIKNPRPLGSKAPVKGQKNQPRRRAARLLSGVAYCALCGGKMHVGTANGAPLYACARYRDRGCETPRMMAELAERAVAHSYLSIVGDHPELEIIEILTDPGVSEELAEIDAALRSASEELLEDESDDAALAATIGRLKARRAQLNTIEATVREEARPTGRTYREAWEAADVDERRRMLLNAVDHVTIRKSLPGEPRKGYHPDRVSLVWRGDRELAFAASHWQ